ncbi:hypothetical protein BVRB_7g161330 [Beta vulgaris subsp. vulgaris]|nr:hypothetical protein BVRB_7g161330 [Beta vulgaris subsp. vulgaris]
MQALASQPASRVWHCSRQQPPTARTSKVVCQGF